MPCVQCSEDKATDTGEQVGMGVHKKSLLYSKVLGYTFPNGFSFFFQLPL
jgi:positive regulator of sigma E activity